MEASTQPQPAVPAPVRPDVSLSNQTTTDTSPKKSNWPAIISLLLFFLVIIVLAVLFLMSRNNAGAADNQSVVSEPVLVTTTTPETTGGNTSTPPATADDSVSPNNFDSRLFYLNFTSPNPITSDTTTRNTYPDGTTWCFNEEASGEDITVSVLQGASDCQGAGGNPQGETFDVTSKDGKSIHFGIDQDPSTGKFSATGVYITHDPLNITFRVGISGMSSDDVKAKSTALVGTLSFDTSMMKTELTDKIVTP